MVTSIDKIVDSIKSGSTSAKEQVELALKRADEASDFNAILSTVAERALSRADEIDALIAEGKDAGKLAGVPFIAKDNILTFGGTTTAASKMLEDFKSPLQATAIERLEAEGAICIGKANLDAFAHGGSTENSAFGPTKNAHDKTRVAGGSSGGSAVAVALDIVPFTLGTDTGGSIRQPASFNGVYGIKPTYGAVSRHGVVAMASSTDVVGCFAKTASEVDIVMGIISGPDKRDMTTLPDFYPKEKDTVTKLKVGVIKDFMGQGVDEDVKSVVTDYIARLKQAGHEIEEVDLPMSKYSLPIYYIITSAEVSSNLARYDGIHYGSRSEGSSIGEIIGKSRDDGFETENKRRIIMGSFVLSSGYYDAYYLKAQKARTLLIDEMNSLLEDCDILVGPVAPTPAFKLGDKVDDPIAMYLSDAMTVSASLAGLPAVSVPAGTTNEGLPVGVQLIGPRKSDARILALAESIEGED